MFWNKESLSAPTKTNASQVTTSSKPNSSDNSYPTEKPTNNVATVAEEMQDIRVAKPLKKKRKSAFSLSIELEEKKEEEEVTAKVDETLPKNPFTQEQVDQFWLSFLEEIKAENLIPTYSILSTAKIKKIKEDLIEVELGSISSETEFEGLRNRIVNACKSTLNNYYIKIETRVTETIASVNHIKTNKIIAKEMAEKNASILKLMSDFGLNIYD